MLYWVLYTTAIGTLAAVFALSVRHKLRDFPRFKASLGAYRLFPDSLLPLAAPAVVALELAAIIALFLPVGPGLWIAFGLLCLYTLAITINLLRGVTAIDCGCGDQPTPISGWLLLRNGALLLIAFPQDPASTGGTIAGWVLVAVLVVVALLFYLTIEQLLANQFVREVSDG